MNKLKFLLLLLLKIPLTPVALAWAGLAIVFFSGCSFIFWLYDHDEELLSTTKEIIEDHLNFLKEWFTTI